jgi:hypothetical protein
MSGQMFDMSEKLASEGKLELEFFTFLISNHFLLSSLAQNIVRNIKDGM